MTRIRAAGSRDLPALLALAGRLAEFMVPAWRTAAQVIDAERGALMQAAESGSAENPILLAEDSSGTPVGFAYLETRTDYFTQRPHAHLSILAVAAGVEGQGVGRALLGASEEWARGRGFEFITLNVFAANTRARALYEWLGYGPETIKYVKPLAGSPGPAGTERSPSS